MDSMTRYKMLSSGRSGDFRNLVRELTNHPDDFPTKTQLRDGIKEIYPDATPEAHEAIYGKLVQIAQARANGADLLSLRNVVDEYVLKVDGEFTDDDRLIPSADDEPVDVAGVLTAMDSWDPTAKRTRAITNAAKASELEANRVRQMRGN
jgi:hypothetical protein